MVDVSMEILDDIDDYDDNVYKNVTKFFTPK